MGGLLELVVSFGIFAVCLSGGVLAIYNNLVATRQLYEPPVEAVYTLGLTPRTGVTLESVIRQDAEAYSRLILAAQNYGGARCESYRIADISSAINGANFQGSNFGAAAGFPLVSSGSASEYVIEFRQLLVDEESAVFGNVDPGNSSRIILARLSRSNGRLLAETLIRCSVSQV